MEIQDETQNASSKKLIKLLQVCILFNSVINVSCNIELDVFLIN